MSKTTQGALRATKNGFKTHYISASQFKDSLPEDFWVGDSVVVENAEDYTYFHVVEDEWSNRQFKKVG